MEFTGHCVAGSVVATGDFTAGHFDLHGGDLQIDVGGSVSSLVSAGDLDLFANTGFNVQALEISLVSTGGDITLNAGGGGIFLEGAGPVTFGPNDSAGAGFRTVRVPNA